MSKWGEFQVSDCHPPTWSEVQLHRLDENSIAILVPRDY